jgi:hypothetical protein
VTTKKQRAERERLNMRIPRALLKWAKTFAQERNTSVTQLVVDHLTRLKEYETSDKVSRPR